MTNANYNFYMSPNDVTKWQVWLAAVLTMEPYSIEFTSLLYIVLWHNEHSAIVICLEPCPICHNIIS